MTAGGFRRTAFSDRLFAGAAVGGFGGVLAVSFGIPGLTVFAAVAALSSLVPPRSAFLAGLLLATGALWSFFSVQEVLRCASNPTSCSATSPAPFAVASALILAAGLLLLVVSRRRLAAIT